MLAQLLRESFLIDRDGILRWASIERATEGLAGIGEFPSEEEILAAGQALPRGCRDFSPWRDLYIICLHCMPHLQECRSSACPGVLSQW